MDCGFVGEVVGVEGVVPEPVGLGAVLRILGATLEERPPDERCASAGEKTKSVTSRTTRTFRIQGPRISLGSIGEQTARSSVPQRDPHSWNSAASPAFPHKLSPQLARSYDCTSSSSDGI
jgi:hypothetical protein